MYFKTHYIIASHLNLRTIVLVKLIIAEHSKHIFPSQFEIQIPSINFHNTDSVLKETK